MHGENLQLIFPISLVKNEERVVVGVATADNVDKREYAGFYSVGSSKLLL